MNITIEEFKKKYHISYLNGIGKVFQNSNNQFIGFLRFETDDYFIIDLKGRI